ncbi:hypothetical protein LZD49_21330 [Dyadobacter sp. CY261]|uniref:hypothetical protein n=1 Tax=Dyadobacter sp. CY261 TaxID=2907203 RepID=UPI001F2F71DF|nr:hypothetical protein [Dyadobacter sp. CY261]MCF0073037.1 hypothetical protein [Dyadobacter sp. CY261]
MNAFFKTAPFIKMKIYITAILVGSMLACKTAELKVDQDLKNETEIYTVKGRQGSLIGQTLSFGTFKTNKIKRGWTFGYSIPFIVKFNGASEKISFTQFDANGLGADVALVSKFRETELSPLEDYFSISLKYKNFCAGSVKINETGWDFIVHNIDGAERSLKGNSTAGFIRNGQSRIEITGIRELEGASKLLTQNDVYGYEFRRAGKVIGAVSTINNGKVWFRNGLDEEMKLVLASVSSGLMLRNSVEDEALSLK